MKIKILFIFVFSFLFLGFRVAYASLAINEIMYDLDGTDTSREWVEIYNPDSTAVEVTEAWRFNDGTSHWMNDKNTFSIPANSYIILADNKDVFLSEHSGFSGIVIDTSMSLNNTGGTLKILDANGNPVDTVTYNSSQGANGNGKSLQKISGSWVESVPTPGLSNGDASGSGTSVVPATSGSVPIISTISEVKQKVVETPKIKTKVISTTLAFAGIPFEIEASTLGYAGELLRYGKYYWSFGDGDSKEVNANQNEKFSHTYYYPGDYEMTLEYYLNYYSQVPETINKIFVKVIPATVYISKVGDEKDFFVELSNNSDYDIDVSKWSIVSSDKSFVLPKNTSIGTKNKITLSPKITNFTAEDKNSLKLLKPTGETAFDYNLSPEMTKIISERNIAKVASVNISENSDDDKKNDTRQNKENVTPSVDLNIENKEIPSSDLGAALILSDEKSNNENRSYFFFWGFVVLLLVSGGTTYYIRGRNNVSKVGDDFKIIDE